MVFFASFAPEGMNPALYSAIYNGSYLIVEFIITVIIIYFLLKRKI
ncbi:MAG: energy-coupled thiamine transporter ThiT [Candidatus Bathyarchaeia archaeon]